MKMCLSPLVFVSLCVQSHSLHWTGRGSSKARALHDLIRPSVPDEGLPLGAEPAGMYERKTQSPIVWLQLEKSLPDAISSWHHVSYKQDAEQQLGMIRHLVG